MWVVIDLDRMGFLPIRSDNMWTAADLAQIECRGNSKLMLCSLTHAFLIGLSSIDLIRLYKNTTGVVTSTYGEQLRNVLREMVSEAIPVREVNAVEADAQASVVPDVRSERYRYKPGSKTPEKMDAKFELDIVKIPKASNEQELARRAPPRPVAPPPRPAGTTPAPTPRAPSTGAPRGPRQHGVRDIVHTVATEMWVAAGSPKDVPTILKLRKEIMVALEEKHSVKRNTSSNELGNWQKQLPL